VIKVVRPKRTGEFPMPELTNKTRAQAERELALAGITGSVDWQDELCTTPVQPGHVCYTFPNAGSSTRADLPVTVVIALPQDRGGQGASAWIAMPDVTGKSPKEARAILEQKGLHDVEITTSDDDKCASPDVVCDQDPWAGNHAYLAKKTTIVVGAKPKHDTDAQAPKHDDTKKPAKPADTTQSVF
jgi:beta-lactam-binding protein with PASTA domain